MRIGIALAIKGERARRHFDVNMSMSLVGDRVVYGYVVLNQAISCLF